MQKKPGSNGRNTIFAKTFYGILLLSIGMLTIFYASLTAAVDRHNKEQLMAGNLGLLRQSAASMEVSLEALAQSMAQSLWNRDFMSYMVSPNTKDQSLYYRIFQQLSSSVSDNAFVTKALFFSTLSDQVLQAPSVLGSKQTCSDPDMLSAYAYADQMPVTSPSRTNTTVVYHQKRLFLVQEMDIASPIGVLIYELDRHAFQSRFFQVDGSDQQILVFSPDGQPLFPQDPGRMSIPWDRTDAFITQTTLREVGLHWSAQYYRYTDQTTGWTYLLPLDRDSLTMPVSKMVTMYLPVLLVMLVLGLLFSWYISQAVYQPINRLMHLVSRPDEEEHAPSGDEADYLALAFSNALEGQAHLRGMIDTIAPEIVESMLKNLLVGRQLTEERSREILAGVGDPFSTRGSFFVIACVMEPSEDRAIHDTEINLHLLAIRKLLARAERSDYCLYDIRVERLTVALVCCFPEGAPVGFLSQEYRRIKQLLQENAQLLPFRLLCERGNLYPSLPDIRHSYREAVEKIQYIQYMKGDEEPSLTLQQEFDRTYLHRQAKQMVELAADGAQAQSMAVMTALLDEIGEKSGDLDGYKTMVRMLVDEVMERVIIYPLSPDDQQLLHHSRAMLDSAALISEREVVAAVHDGYQTVLRVISSYSRKHRYRYVEMAKEYIASHYMDSDLSLMKVGDHVGISASYLSELFNEIADDKFSSYLAAYRVEKAQQLLRTTTLTIKDVGYRCGFNSIQNFIRVFKRCAGQPPGQYRELVQGPDR